MLVALVGGDPCEPQEQEHVTGHGKHSADDVRGGLCMGMPEEVGSWQQLLSGFVANCLNTAELVGVGKTEDWPASAVALVMSASEGRQISACSQQG